MKIEDRQILTREQIVARLRAVADGLESGSYALGEERVTLPDAAEFELGYKAHKGKQKLEIELGWRTPGEVRVKE